MCVILALYAALFLNSQAVFENRRDLLDHFFHCLCPLVFARGAFGAAVLEQGGRVLVWHCGGRNVHRLVSVRAVHQLLGAVVREGDCRR